MKVGESTLDQYTPEFGETLRSSYPSRETLEFLMRRRSVIAKNLSEPGPSAPEIQAMLSIGARVPDHGKLAPWRFVLFQGGARQDFGELLANRWNALHSDCSEEVLKLERNRFVRAPLVVAVVSDAAADHKIPEWEQHLSAGAVCQNLLLAANALGYAAQWITEWYAYDPVILDSLGVRDNQRIAGFIYVGSAADNPQERKRPKLDALVTDWASDLVNHARDRA